MIAGSESSNDTANTDDLLLSGVEALSSFNSSCRAVPHEVSGGPSTPESQQLPAGAEASSVGKLNRSSAIRKLDFAAPSQLSASTEAHKSCLRHAGSPQKSNSVSFVQPIRMPNVSKLDQTGVSVGSIKTITPPSSHRNINVQNRDVDWEEARTEIQNLMQPFKDLTTKVDVLMQAEKARLNSNFGYALEKDVDFRAYIARMNMVDCKDMLETEHLKKRHLERNVMALQNRIMNLEERLALSETMIKEQSDAVNNAHQLCNKLVTDAVNEQQNWQACKSSYQAETCNLKDNLLLAKNYNHTLAKRVEDLESRLAESDSLNHQYLSNKHLLQHQNDSLNNQVSRLQDEIQSKDTKISSLESENGNFRAKETELMKEVLELERLLKQSNCDIQKLKLELSSEKSSAKLFLEQKDREMKMNADSLRKDKDSEIQEIRHTLSSSHSRELNRIRDDLRNQIDDLTRQNQTVTKQRDLAMLHLARLEEDLDDRKRRMCHEVQSKLADKYRELVAEFSRESPLPLDTGRSTLPYSSTHNDMQAAVADHFLKQISAVHPSTEAQNTATGYFSAQFDNSGRRSQLHSFLLQKFGSTAPSDQMFKK